MKLQLNSIERKRMVVTGWPRSLVVKSLFIRVNTFTLVELVIEMKRAHISNRFPVSKYLKIIHTQPNIIPFQSFRCVM